LSSLLARFAENHFWMARYVERAENLARILDVNETFARDSTGVADWLPIVQLHADDKAFFAKHKKATADAVIQFYIADKRNPTSIAFAIRAAHENARALRHLISIELWTQLNVFQSWLTGLRRRDYRHDNLSRLCAQIKEKCQLHRGIVEGTMYRDQGALFYLLGKQVERADQITRLVDIKYHRLLPPASAVGSPIDISQWNALLRSAAAYHAYRRVHPSEMTPRSVAGFMLLDAGFSRSLRTCIGEIERLVRDLAADPALAPVLLDQAALERLRALVGQGIDQVIARGLHEYLDEVQIQLIRLGDQLGRTYFAQEAA
jgi:uncharacterized alpha-E superfamily protein